MTSRYSVLDGDVAQPLVSCTGCGFAWYGHTAAHGLSVIGCCPRCRGALQFHEHGPTPQSAPDTGDDLQPWQVLGPPTGWAH